MITEFVDRLKYQHSYYDNFYYRKKKLRQTEGKHFKHESWKIIQRIYGNTSRHTRNFQIEGRDSLVCHEINLLVGNQN